MSAPIPEFAHSLVTRDARGVYTLQIHDAKSLNILATPVTLGLTAAARWIAAQEDARAVVIRGSGERAFIGGANIYEMAELDPDGARGFITNLRHLCDAVADIPVPTIARIPGFCLGAGMELAAACDIRLGTHDAVFGMPEVRVGIPSVIHAVLLPALIGPGATNWLLLTGETVDGAQALRWGYLQFACEAAELDALVERTVAPIAASGPRAVRSQKSLLRYWSHSSVEAGLDRSVAAFGEAFTTSEPREYMAPFLARKQQREQK
ncbi:enoyl-CoA hydratase [Bordetella bronchiseptica]|uniref:enoyl-CoA hydratase n=1 Tax=Bordetella bronchiseptica TaxID=518 RepID=UPI00028B644F|nr:enoyl-CoA hydratase [Bordetella bronchiseptica]KCV30156.1 enoyl-CoA hydratase/isomerase family protein [Bordetella bronchiseptica 00-P-2730]KDD53087.1 enoyl-CoA hydratase/isomerase family protein [Bordetella bronchiseptica OSU553]AUL14336.1 enoyl-CoA hydratase [Bordetella bronchiseptica]AWP57427.1 enoyl-CoA hydratase [Bordetella bronchiseptica]AWQ04169.1 enoyl-CoA hydratase [Bordetella bronchiseptica]